MEVEYEDLPAAATTAEAAAPDAPLVWPDRRGNRAFTIKLGDAASTDAAFARAAHVVELDLANPRMAGMPLEPRGAFATPLPDGRFELWTPAGKPHPLRDTLCDHVLHWPREKLRVRVGNIGGGFGVKNVLYPEQVVALWAAARPGRPVRWCADRSESFLADIQGRDQVNRAALALDAEGRILALRLRTLAGLGAYLAPRGVVQFAPFSTRRDSPMATERVIVREWRIARPISGRSSRPRTSTKGIATASITARRYNPLET